MIYLRYFKRFLDVCFACLLLIALFPMLLLAAAVIKATSCGPALYKQERVGKDCRPFLLYKFRTMKPFSDQEGLRTHKNDPRITFAGRYLRLTSIDELPQLLNVLKGEMSLVGPRPATLEQAKDYTEEEWVNRHRICPGITGLAQVNGRSNMDFPQRRMHDLSYVESVSLRLDVSILLKTIAAVCNPLRAN